jgi:hypothetical protein
VITGFDSNGTWETLNNRTWRSASFAGSEIIFYETANGLRKAILQVHGSGVMLAGATIFDIETDSEGILLTGGLDLMNKDDKVLESLRLTLTNDSIFKLGDQNYSKKYDYLIAFNWQSRDTQIEHLDIELLKSIPIGKKSIYAKGCFSK